MRKRILSWLVTITMVSGCFVPYVPSFAAEDILEDITESDDSELSEESAPDIQEEASAELTDLDPTGEISGPVLKLRSIDLMYGESIDNADGQLNSLFAPVVTDGDKEYFLMADATGEETETITEESDGENLTFEISYKFFAEESAFNPEDSSFAELSDIEKEQAFDAIETADISVAPEGSRIFAAARATTSDGKVAYAVTEIDIVKSSPEIEFTASDEISDDAAANFDVEEERTLPDNAAESEPTLDEEEVEDVSESGLVQAGPIIDPDISENKIGFINRVIRVSDDEYEALGPGITIRSKQRSIKVEIYASRKEDRSSAKRIAETELNSRKYAEWTTDSYMTGEQKYYRNNAVPIDFTTLDAGKWYLFGRFYTGEGLGGYEDSKDTITLTVDTATPVVTGINDASSISSANGDASFAPCNGRGTLLYAPFGAGPDETATAVLNADMSFKAENLAPGRYFAYFSTPCWFSGILITDSLPTEFFVNVREKEVTSLTLKNLTEGIDIDGIHDVYIRKGATMRIGATVTPTDAPVTGVTFSSSAPNVISVDAQGNCKALTDQGSATITVSTKAQDAEGKPRLTKKFTAVANTPLKIKSARFTKNTITETYEEGKELNLEIELDNDVFCPVKWSVDDTSVAYFKDDYLTDAEDGKAYKPIVIKAPGRAVVTANLEGVKTVTCTIIVNGTEGNDKPFFDNGRYLTGFCALDLTRNEVVATGDSVLKMKSVRIKYYDPETFYPVKGPDTVTIKKKLYYFDGNCNLLRCTRDDLDGKEYFSFCDHIINRLGEVLTGWQREMPSSNEYYYSPADAKRVKSSWIPRGKGLTWVNVLGVMADDGSQDLGRDGMHRIDGQDYYFKGGLRQHGFIYFDADGKETTLKKAGYARYFDPATGAMRSGLDEDDGEIQVAGKKYLANDSGIIALGQKVANTTGGYCITDNTGAVLMNRFVSLSDGTYYAMEDGTLFKEGDMIIGGKCYHFANYKLVASGEGTLSDYYLMDGSAKVSLYTKASNAKKPEDGGFFYIDEACKKKVANCLIYDKPGNIRALDKSGRIAEGPYKIGQQYLFFDPEDDFILAAKSDPSGPDRYHICAYKGKFYACDQRGQILTENRNTFTGVTGSRYVRVKNSKGELMTGLQTIEGKKYLFLSDATLCKPSLLYGTLEDEVSGKVYLADPGYDPEIDGPLKWYVYAPGKTMRYRTMIFNKDGSAVNSGWATVDGRKYYVFMGMLMPSGGLVRIGGKYYTFNSDSSMATGWVKINNPEVIDLNSFYAREYEGTYYFFFGKNGAAETGWKTMNTIRTDAIGNVLDDLRYGVTGPKTRIYFNQAGDLDIPVGALARNVDITVNKKTYRFSADGSLITGKESPVYKDPSTDAEYDGLKSYRNADGTIARGRTIVKTSKGSSYFYFRLDDGVKETNAIRKTGSKWYYYGANGAMSTALSLDSPQGEAFAVFNADGSINHFELRNGYGTVLKNTTLTLNGATGNYCVLDGKGLPATGIRFIAEVGHKCYFEDDGRPTGAFTSANKIMLRKVGSRYYMLADGVLLDSSYAKDHPTGEIQYDSGVTSVLIDEGTFSLFSPADRDEVFKCFQYNEAVVEIQDSYTEFYKRGNLHVALGPDGSIKVGEVVHGNTRLYTNRLGIVKDNISPFYKQGTWKIAYEYSSDGPGSYEFRALDIQAAMAGHYDDAILVFNYDTDRNITSIMNKATGMKASGDYLLEDFEENIVIKVAGGKLSPGKVKIREGASIMEVTTDKDYGFGLWEFDE